MAAPPEASPPLGPDGALAADVPCRRCAYNLRGLRPERRCPECGTPIGRSIVGDLLEYCDPDWVARLARGATIVLWSFLIGLPAAILDDILTHVAGRAITITVAILMIAMGSAFIVLAVMFVRLTYRFRKALRLKATLARTHWSTPI